MRKLVAVALFAVATLWPSSASAAILTPEDSSGLQDLVRQARDQQGICYSWEVTVLDQGTGATQRDYGSIAGSAPIQWPDCPKSVQFSARVTYTSETSESEDYSTYQIRSSGLPTTFRRDVVSLNTLTNDPEEAIFQAVSALPAVIAESGSAPWMPLETNTQPIEGAAPTNTPGSDWLRSQGALLLTLSLGLVAAIVWAGYAYLTRNSSPRGEHFATSYRHHSDGDY